MIPRYLRGFLGRCPYCGKGRMARGLFALHDHCSNCGLVFQNAPGDFTGAVVLSYGVTSFPTLLVGMLLLVVMELSLMTVIAIGILMTLIIGTFTYQPLKGLWIAFLVDGGALRPPEHDAHMDSTHWTGEGHL
jgi:uncharacterized protein (DUF983 family)